MAMHGSQKLFGAFGGHGVAGTAGFFQAMGFTPGIFWAWVVSLVEFFGGLALVFGLLTRLASVALIVDMLVALFKVHLAGGFFLPKGFEYPFVIIGALISLILLGSGPYSLDALVAKWMKWGKPVETKPVEENRRKPAKSRR